MRSPAALLFAAALAAALPAAESGPKSHRDFGAAAAAAYARKDYAAARTAMQAALALRPDSPRYLYNLAALCSLTGDPTAAFAHLRRLSALGVYLPVERDPDFAALQGKPEFIVAVRELGAHREPQGEAEVLFELPGRTGIIEGLAARDRSGDIFFSDVHHRGIWRRDHTGQVTRFTAEDDELLGIFGLAIDEARNTLWAATAALPEMSGFTKDLKGHAALAEFNLATSELRRVVPVPGDGRDHLLGDLAVAPDGTVYATDSAAPVIWQLAPGIEEIEKFIESPQFVSLQGIVVARRALIVADYANGLFAIDLPGGAVRPLAPPPGATLLGLDGLVPAPGGLIAVQNGVEPQRVLRVSLADDLKSVSGITVLAAALPGLTDLTLVTLVQGRPTVIAGSGWEGFDPAKAAHPAAHTVRIFQLPAP